MNREEDIMDLNKIIVLANNEKYLTIDKATKNDIDYYYIAEVNKEETDIKDNYKIVTIDKDEEYSYINEVLGEQNLKDILPLFIK